jgi:hypothetical protein
VSADDYDPRAFIAANEWAFARTVPDAPHWYLIAERSTDPDQHCQMVEWVNRTGLPGTFQGNRYRYARMDDGFEYWVSRAPLWSESRAPILNRRRAEP